MNPVTHFLAGWAVANTVPMERRGQTVGSVLVFQPFTTPQINGSDFIDPPHRSYPFIITGAKIEQTNLPIFFNKRFFILLDGMLLQG